MGTSAKADQAFQGSAEIKITSCNFYFINNFYKIIDLLALCIHAQPKYIFGSILAEFATLTHRERYGALTILGAKLLNTKCFYQKKHYN